MVIFVELIAIPNKGHTTINTPMNSIYKGDVDIIGGAYNGTFIFPSPLKCNSIEALEITQTPEIAKLRFQKIER